MKRLLLRADDLGYSEAVNYGIEKTVKHGLISSVGVMVNMPATQHGVDLIKNYNISLGLHTNICAEKPLIDPQKIPSLVDDRGYFKTSATYRNATKDLVIFDEVILEIEAQYKRFIELFERKPDYFEGHAIASPTFFKGLEYVADKYQLTYSPFVLDKTPVTIGQSLVQIHIESLMPNYDPRKMIEKMVNQAHKDIVQLGIFHPGYLDNYLLTHSSLLHDRCLEVDVLSDSKLKNWLTDNKVKLIDYRDL